MSHVKSDRYSLYLSYSGMATYRLCPKKYKLAYVDEIEASFDPRNSIFGSAIGKLFEWFYERRAWASSKPTSLVMSWIKSAVDVVCAKEKFEVRSDPGFEAVLMSDLETYVPAGVETIRRHKLVTPGSVAEFDMTQLYTKDGVTMKLGGRSDFLHRARETGVTLQDGKGSKYRDQYVDTNQLVWYATLHYLKFGVAPDRVGFIYWRFPSDPVQWVDYGEEDIRATVDRAFETEKKVRLKMFEASPSVGACKRCDYISGCEEGTSLVRSLKVEESRVEDSIFGLEQV